MCRRLLALAPSNKPRGYKDILHARKQKTEPQGDDQEAHIPRIPDLYREGLSMIDVADEGKKKEDGVRTFVNVAKMAKANT